MKNECTAITQKQIIMKIIIWWREPYKKLTQIWKDFHEMVLTSPSASQTRAVVSDFKAWLWNLNSSGIRKD